MEAPYEKSNVSNPNQDNLNNVENESNVQYTSGERMTGPMTSETNATVAPSNVLGAGQMCDPGTPDEPPLGESFQPHNPQQFQVVDGFVNSAANNNNEAGVTQFTSGNSEYSDEIDLLSLEEMTFYSAQENDFGDDNVWGLLSGVAGNIYEWYDFAVYGLFSSEIGGCFFPDSNKQVQLLSSFGVFMAAFIMRPIGAIFFGEIGDRMCGRRNALIFSILLITVPSILMGLLPTYNAIGVAAPIFLVILRMMQGMSVGGQLAGSYVMSIEQSTSKNRGFRGAVCDASSVGGFVLASFVANCVRESLSVEDVNEWGWRLPFLFSVILAPVLYCIVTKTEESKFWAERTEQKETESVVREAEQKHEKAAFLDLLSSPFRRRQLLGAICVLSVKIGTFYTLFVWTPVYLHDLRGLMLEKYASLINLSVVSTYILFILIAGKISDSLPHRSDLLRIGVPALGVAAPVMFGMFESESMLGVFLGQLQYAFCLSLVQGGIAAWEVELWMADPSLSFTGVAVGHNVASTLFGGSLPIIATELFYYSDGLDDNDDNLYKRLIPGLYITLLSCLSLYALNFIVRHPHDVKTGEKILTRAVVIKNKRKKEKNIPRSVIDISNVGGHTQCNISRSSTFEMDYVREGIVKEGYRAPNPLS